VCCFFHTSGMKQRLEPPRALIHINTIAVSGV
jgi:hypothetical protein